MTNKRLMDMTMSELDQAIDGVIAKYPGEPPPENVLGGVKQSDPPPQVRKKFTRAELIALARRIQDS